MVVLNTCNNEENLIKMKGLECYNDYVTFFQTLKGNSNSSEIL